jgi:transposase
MPYAGGDMLNWGGKTVYLCCGQTDMRKQINGLMTIVKEGFNLNPFNKALYVFCNKSRNLLKILEWDEDGFWLYIKRLEKGHFRWPQAGDTPTMTLTAEELTVLLSGVRIELKIKRDEVWERNIS